MQILNLPEIEFMSSFFETINDLKNTSSQKELSYKLRFNGNKYFYDLNLENLIFTAKNKYELWLLIYKFLIQHTSVKIINKVSFDNDNNLQILNDMIDKNKDEFYSIGEYWDIINICSQDYEYDYNHDYDMKHIVNLVVDDLFYNKILWIENCRNEC